MTDRVDDASSSGPDDGVEVTILGRVGYQAYGDATGWVNHLGRPMPAWEALPETIRSAWEAAACAIADDALRGGGQT